MVIQCQISRPDRFKVPSEQSHAHLLLKHLHFKAYCVAHVTLLTHHVANRAAIVIQETRQ